MRVSSGLAATVGWWSLESTRLGWETFESLETICIYANRTVSKFRPMSRLLEWRDEECRLPHGVVHRQDERTRKTGARLVLWDVSTDLYTLPDEIAASYHGRQLGGLLRPRSARRGGLGTGSRLWTGRYCITHGWRMRQTGDFRCRTGVWCARCAVAGQHVAVRPPPTFRSRSRLLRWRIWTIRT